jgi:hypothetical protein
MSESLARALSGNLTCDSSSWDKLLALAMGSATVLPNEPLRKHPEAKPFERTARESLLNSLGVSLLGFKVAQRADLFTRAADDLRDSLRWKLKTSRQDRQRIAEWAIREWVVDICPTCSGAGHIFDNRGVERICNTCDGNLKRKYTQAERFEKLGYGGVRADRAMDAALLQISVAVGFCVRQAREKLE